MHLLMRCLLGVDFVVKINIFASYPFFSRVAGASGPPAPDVTLRAPFQSTVPATSMAGTKLDAVLVYRTYRDKLKVSSSPDIVAHCGVLGFLYRW